MSGIFSLYLNKVYERAIIETVDYEFDLAGIFTFCYSPEGFVVRVDTRNSNLMNHMLHRTLCGEIVFPDFTFEFSSCRAEIVDGYLTYYFNCDFLVSEDGSRYELPYDSDVKKAVSDIVFKLKMVTRA